MQGLLPIRIPTFHSWLALPWAGAAQCAGLEPGPHGAMLTRGKVSVCSCRLPGSPPSLILGRLNTASCLCVVITPWAWSCWAFQLLMPGLLGQLDIEPGPRWRWAASSRLTRLGFVFYHPLHLKPYSVCPRTHTCVHVNASV